MPLLGSVPGSQGVAVDGGQRFALCQPDRDQVQGLMNSEPARGRPPELGGALGPELQALLPGGASLIRPPTRAPNPACWSAPS
jgi:hypothetical protein